MIRKKENRPEAADHGGSKTRNQHWIDFLRSTGNYLAIGQAFREQTEADAVVVAGPACASWIPTLSGQRILLAADEPMTDGRPARELALKWMVFSNNSNRIETVAREWRRHASASTTSKATVNICATRCSEQRGCVRRQRQSRCPCYQSSVTR